MILVIILYVLLASTFTLAKAAVSYMPPILFIGIRMLIAGAILLGYALLNKKKYWRFERKDWPLFFGIILFHIYLAYVLEFISLPCLTSFKTSLLYSISPFLTALVGYFLLREQLSIQKWVGLLIGFIGLIPITLEQAPCSLLSSGSGALSFGPELTLFGAILASVLGWIFMKKLVLRSYSPVSVNGIGMFAGGILALITSLLVEGTPRLYAHAHQARDFAGISLSPALIDMLMVVLIMGLLIIIANIISYNFYGYLLGRYSATFLSFAGFLCPLFTALFGWLFLHEKASLNFFLSSGIILIGLIIFYRDELRTKL